MAKKMTLNELGGMIEHVVKHMATKEDIARLEHTMATKDGLAEVAKRSDQRIDGLTVKVDGVQNTIDREAIVRADQRLPERMERVEKHLGLSR